MFRTPLVNHIIDLERLLEKILKKREYLAVSCQDIHGEMDSILFEINLPYYGGISPEEQLVQKDNLLKAFDGQSIGTGSLTLTTLPWILVYILLIKFMELSQLAFLTNVFHKQKRYLHSSHLTKPQSITLRTFISRL